MISNFVCNLLNTDYETLFSDICQKIITMIGQKECSDVIVNMYQHNTPASHFDSSSESGLATLIKKFEILKEEKEEDIKKENQNKLQIIKPSVNSYEIILRVEKSDKTYIDLINLKYIKNEYSWVKHVISLHNGKYNVKSDVKGKQGTEIIDILYDYFFGSKGKYKTWLKGKKGITKKGITKEEKQKYINDILNDPKKSIYKALIYDEFKWENITGETEKKKETVDEYVEQNIPLESQIEYSLEIPNFFSIKGLKPRYSTDCSVKKISEEINTSKGPFSKSPNFQYMYYKTLGDFGQILTTYAESFDYGTKKYHKFSYFYTFDRICSYISALFNPGTILENDTQPVYPIDIFIPIIELDESSAKKQKTKFGKIKNKSKSKSKSKVNLKLKVKVNLKVKVKVK